MQGGVETRRPRTSMYTSDLMDLYLGRYQIPYVLFPLLQTMLTPWL